MGTNLTSDVLCAGLLREVCGLTLAQIASMLSCSISSAHRRHSGHLERVRLDDRYAVIAVRTLARALGRMFSPAPILGMPLRGSSEEDHRNPADLPPIAEESHLTP